MTARQSPTSASLSPSRHLPVRSLPVRTEKLAVTGLACRLPGAANPAALWDLLDAGRCAVGTVPRDRWRAERFLHPRRDEPGFSYTFAGGYLDDVMAFDPAVFGISPREAAQIDPQQRLLLELVWEALEDAEIAPGSLAGSEIGVYVGGSALDYGNLHLADPASVDRHFMTGNTLSLLANRISHSFDFRGPSLTVDTACSSSLVALAEAQAAIAAGRIDMAIVAGVSLLLSYAPFVGFSRASMLSPTGLCRPFAAAADGYVRAEGAVALVLCRLDTAIGRGDRVRAVIEASGLNSDGRTTGVALPSADRQADLLHRLYDASGIDPQSLGFVEAHGTGTRVGDPAEANALGTALGRYRRSALPIGSVKSNIGHLEPASGLAGLLKAILALERGRLPRSLHAEAANPEIDFTGLNLAVATRPVALPPAGPLFAGVSSFGFGGTNAHVVLRRALTAEQPAITVDERTVEARALVISAYSRPALAALATAYADAIGEGGETPGAVASAAAWQRDRAGYRLIVPVETADRMVRRIGDFGRDEAGTLTGLAPAQAPTTCFVFAGNGCQWDGMGRLAFARNRAFRDRFETIDALFRPLSGWSLVERLLTAEPNGQLSRTSIAQPLLFALQTGLVAGLDELGLRPDFVLGHSVGEVAAAEAAGLLSLDQAVRLIFERSHQQEAARGLGSMAVAKLSHDEAVALLADLIARGVEVAGLSVAAINSPYSVTVTGPGSELDRFAAEARLARVPVHRLDLAYPFHSALLDPLRPTFLSALGRLELGRGAPAGRATMISTVTGKAASDHLRQAEYWWRNLRDPVRFSDAVARAARDGADLFVEIGPKPILGTNIRDVLQAEALPGTAIAGLSDKDDRDDSDPVLAIAARAHLHGCRLDDGSFFGPRPGRRIALPPYPWQRSRFDRPATDEAIDMFGGTAPHPLIGSRRDASGIEWRHLLDARAVPYLADHRIEDQIVVPGSGLVEMALAAGREIFPDGALTLDDFDLTSWLTLPSDGMREISVRYAASMQRIEIWSRARFGGDVWTLHARGRLGRRQAEPEPKSAAAAIDAATEIELSPDDIYRHAEAAGVCYGPSFRRVLSACRRGSRIDVALGPIDADSGAFRRPHLLHPVALDAAFHALFACFEQTSAERRAFLPVRIGSLRLDRDDMAVTQARVIIRRTTTHSVSIALELQAADGTSVAALDGVLFRAVILDRRDEQPVFFHEAATRLAGRRPVPPAIIVSMPGEAADSWLLLEAFGRSFAWHAVRDRPSPPPLDDPFGWSLLRALERTGLAVETADGWSVSPDADLPAPSAILQTIAADHPEASADILLAARALAALDHRDAAQAPPRPALRDQFETGSLLLEPLYAALMRQIAPWLTAASAAEPVKILVAEPCCLGLLDRLMPLARDGLVAITIIASDRRRLEAVAARLSTRNLGAASTLAMLAADDAAVGTALPSFDLAVAMAFDVSPASDQALMAAMVRHLAPGRSLLLLDTPDLALFDVLFGRDPGWFAHSVDPTLPVGRVAAARIHLGTLDHHGLILSRIVEAGGGGRILVTEAGQPVRAAQRRSVEPRTVLVIDRQPAGPGPLRLLSAALAERGHAVRHVEISGERDYCALPEPTDPAPATALFHARGDLAEDLIALARLLPALDGRASGLWILLDARDEAASDALTGFARVAANEYPSLAVRVLRLPLSGTFSPSDACDLADICFGADGIAETELELAEHALSATRIVVGTGPAAVPEPVEAVRLAIPARGLSGRFDWVPSVRRAPERGEVEIAISGAGLNYRDLMLASGLLNDDVLDDGLAGQTIGFECAGRVLRVGADVRDLAVGDAVMGFGAPCFASHLTADARVFSAVPPAVSLAAAASIPVAFLTAWYALVHLAKVKPGEWVLIHGAAGGVGLAALQIARLRGGRVVATAGSDDKRALATLYGAEHVLDSRSTVFLDEIQERIGGVDVVLNSLYGEGMLASLKCLKPFGRFIELGKRDYTENTLVGLRPFRRNLSYFGVDLDQLLAADLAFGQAMMAEICARFAANDLVPLPYRALAAHDSAEAFRLMQASAHVGKLVICPPQPPVATVESPGDRFVPGPGLHLVMGGTQGFGFETALWLAEQGAQSIAVASRSGRLDAALEARAAAIRGTGVTFLVEAVDVTDADAVDGLITSLVARHGRLAGIIHAAAVQDDALIRDLTPDRLVAVLAPKTVGADALDRAARAHAVDYFVVYSSATTLIGNPGQAAYVAANAYLQGLMRRRRADGLPGLAVAWGAIADAGVLARDPSLAARLERLTGMTAMPARMALRYLERLLARPERCAATVYCVDLGHAAPAADLAVLASPTFAGMFRHGARDSGEARLDIAALLAKQPPSEVHALVAAAAAAEVGRILRLPVDEIDRGRPLNELGMDSLMSLELKIGLERRFGIELPVVAIAAVRNVNDLAATLVKQATAAGDPAATMRVPAAGDIGTVPDASAAPRDDAAAPDRMDDATRLLVHRHLNGDAARVDVASLTDAIKERRADLAALL